MSDNQHHLDSITSRLDELIANAPDSTADPCMVTHAPIISAKPNLVRESSGWGGKYREPIALSGEEWLATLEEAKAIVSRGGIVALLGGRGPGKTQMAAEIARAGDWPKDKPGRQVVGQCAADRSSQTASYVRAMDLFLDLRDTGKKGSSISEKDVLAPHQLAGLFVIDEFQERGGSDWENRIITGLIDRRYSNNLPTIIIANLDRREMGAALNPSVVDRIRENGKAFTFDWPSFRTPQ